MFRSSERTFDSSSTCHASSRHLEPTWGTYGWVPLIYAGGIALMASWLLTGCRFGNYEQDQPVTSIQGYYETAPQSLELCTTVAGKSQCADGQTSQVPSFIANAMADPEAFILGTTGDGASLVNPNNQSYSLPTALTDSSTLSLNLQNGVDPTGIMPWLDGVCVPVMELSENGDLNQSNQNFRSGSTLPLLGHIELEIHVTEQFDTACTTLLTAYAACAANPSQCGGTTSGADVALQSAVQDMIAPYVQTGLLTVSQLPSLQELSFTVEYQ